MSIDRACIEIFMKTPESGGCGGRAFYMCSSLAVMHLG
jgi:hypothetical protein